MKIPLHIAKYRRFKPLGLRGTMSVIFIDGFDHYSSNEIEEKWDVRSTTFNNQINSSTGQNGSDSWRQTSGNYIQKNFSNKTQLVFGAWMTFTTQSTSASTIFQLLQNASEEFRINYNGGRLEVYGDGSIRGIADYHWTEDVEHFIECKVTINEVAGSVEIRADGNTVLSLSSINTGNQAVNQFRLGQQSGILGTLDWDDFYLFDQSGSTNNDFLGPMNIETLLPNASGTNSDWTVLTGPSNYEDVDEDPPDGDTTYVSTNTVGDKDSYNFADLAMTAGTIHTVQINQYAKKTGIGTRTLNVAVESNATSTTTGTANSLSGDYKFERNTIDEDPDTSSAWSVSGFNAAEFGPHLVS